MSQEPAAASASSETEDLVMFKLDYVAEQPTAVIEAFLKMPIPEFSGYLFLLSHQWHPDPRHHNFKLTEDKQPVVYTGTEWLVQDCYDDMLTIFTFYACRYLFVKFMEFPEEKQDEIDRDGHVGEIVKHIEYLQVEVPKIICGYLGI